MLASQFAVQHWVSTRMWTLQCLF